jgi:ribonuclease Z
MNVTLLGTGMPAPDPARRGPSQVIEIDRQLLLVDCGAGALHRLLEAGYSLGALRRIAITHLHSDHISGLVDLLWAGWVGDQWETPPPIAGPPGTAEFVRRLLDAFAYDIRIRTAEGGLRREGLEPAIEEIEEGWATRGEGWRLRAFRVEHQPVDQAFGFRLDADDGSVVISGDTRRSENLIRHARHTDLLVHEVIWRPGMERLIAGTPDPKLRARRKKVLDYHTPADDLGEVAAAAEAKHLALSHLIFAGGAPDDLRADVRKNFSGRLTIGEDLATFTIG